MTTFNRPRLITPPREEEDIYPYRRVWRSITTEYSILIGVTVGLYVAVAFLGVQVPEVFRSPLNITLALLPAGLWLIFSRLAENTAKESRPQLVTVFVLSSLIASAIGIPLVENFLQPERWLSLEPALSRIIGYTVTTGIVQEFLKYLVLRYALPAAYFRVRLDGIAYAAAIASGYALMLNLHFALNQPLATPDAAALRILGVNVLCLVGSAIISYGWMETLLGNAAVFLLPFTLVLAALVNGIAIPLRVGLMNATLTLDGGATRPYFAIGFVVAVLVVPLVILAFLYRAADRREEDIQRGQE